MDVVLELLEDPAYRHVLLNHLPITGLAVAWLMLAWTVLQRRWPSMVFALAVVGLISAAGLLVMSTGDDAYPVVFDSLDSFGQDWLDYHVVLADRFGHVLTANGILAGLAIAVGWFREPLRIAAGIVVLVSTLAALVAVTAIAEAGGMVRHSEFRLVDPPEYDRPGRIR